MVSLGKTSTPEFGSPCYTEPEGAPPAVTPWDRTRMAGGSCGGAAAAVAAGLVAGRAGLRRRRLDPDPGLLLRPGRAQAPRGRISGHPMYGDPVGLATAGLAGPDGARRRGAAGRAGRSSRSGDPVLGTAAVGVVPRRLRRASPGRLRIARFSEPVIADVPSTRSAWRPGRTRRGCWSRSGHEVVDIEVPLPPRGGAGLRDLLGGAHRAVASVPPETRAPAAPAHALALRAGPGRSAGRSSGWRSGRCAGYAAGALDRPRAVRRGADADPGRPAAAGRGDPQRRRPGAPTSRARRLHAVDLGLERHRHARRLAAAALDPRGPAGRRDARRPARRRRSCCSRSAAQVEAAAPWAERRPPGW